MENQSGPYPYTAQQHKGSSSSTAVLQEAGLRSHTDHGKIDQADDGYLWRMCGQSTNQSTALFHYQCAQENCLVQKSVARSIDGQTIETVYKGIHKHSGRSVPGTGNGGDQLSASSDSEEDDDGNVGIDGDAAGGHANAVKRLRSKVWEEFKPIFINGKLHNAECKHCQRHLSAKSSGGTKHLGRHLQNHCPAKPGTIKGKQKCSAWQPDLPFPKKSKYGHQNPLEELMRSIVSNLCPFSVMYSASFAQFLAGSNPVINMVQQATVEEKFLSVFHNEKLKLEEKIAATPGGVFLSLGQWECSFSYEVQFICFTAHFIDEDWKINRKTIRCSLVDHSNYSCNYLHWQPRISVEDTKMVLKKVVQDWVPMKKLLGATLMPSNFEDELTAEKDYLLPKWKVLIFPCIVHGLHELMSFTAWGFVRMKSTWSDYMTNSPERKQKLQEVLSQLHLERSSYGSQGWYVRFYLYETALQFVKSFPLPDAGLNQSDTRLPSTDDLEEAENFCRIARPVYHAIKTVSDYHMTINSYFHAIWSLRETLHELAGIKNIERVFEVEGVQRTFDENWNRWYLWLSIAVVLDPRYKLAFIELCFEQAFSLDSGKYISEVRAKLYEVYIRYFYANEQSNNASDTQNNAPLQNQSQNYTRAQAALDEFKELSEYLRGEVCPQDESFDILKWWSSNSSAYPTLAKMARDILAIPGCAVSSESAFDDCDKRAELFNGRLCPETAEALICAQDWIK